MFGRHTDYHGSRRYAAEKPIRRDADNRKLRTSLTLAWLKLQVEKFLRAGAPVSRTTWLVRGDEKHFTMLGLRPAERPSRPAITDIFPIAKDDGRTAEKKPRRPH